MIRSALVTGASGAIGPVLVARLQAAGVQVRALARHAPPPGLLPPAVEVVTGDLSNPEALQRAATGVDCIFHLAAKLHINDPAPALRAEYQEINVEGTRRIIGAAQAACVQRVIFFSTISVYGPSRAGQIWDENTPPQPQTLYARTKSEAEAIALAARHPQTAAPLAVVLRLAAVYGPRVKGNYARLLTALRHGRYIQFGPGTNRRTLVYDQDVAAAALLAATHPGAAGQIYNVTDGHIHSFNAILAAMSVALDRRPPRLHLPAAPLALGAGLVERGFALAGRRAPLGRATVAKLWEDVAVSGNKLQRELGFGPQYDLVAGWRDTIRRGKGAAR
jgi:UDP-glucose 4-epimerase